MIGYQDQPKRKGGLGRALRLLISTILSMALITISSSLALQQAQWSNFQPQNWVRSNTVTCQVQVTSPIGFYDAAEYRYTTTGDIQSASWITTNLAISGVISTTKTISVTNLNLPDSANQNRIQFRCKNFQDVWEASPVYPVFVDATPPGNPAQVTSSSHTVARWSNDRTVEMQWSGAADATSQVYGYSYVWDTQPSTLPPEVANTTATYAMSLPLPEGNSHYFHIRTRDNAGNWATTAIPSGPYYIDLMPPDNPTFITSPSHALGVWSRDNTIEVTWNAGSDNLSGIGGYSLVWDNNLSTLPDTITETISLRTTSPPMSDSNNIWFHLRTADRAGNWSATALHLGPFLVDATPPRNPTVFQSSHITNTWSNDTTVSISWNPASDDGSGVAGYSYRWDTHSNTTPPETILITGTNSTSPPLPHGGRYYFHLRTADRMGNWSAAVHRGPFLIDTVPPTSPSILSAYPSGWTRVNSFTVEWERNPIDPSGIGGAYCKLDAPPISNTDYYTLARGDDIHTISGIPVPTDGIHGVYVWLQDGAGNSDFRTASPLPNAFRLDRAAPTSSYGLSRPPDHGEWYTDTVTVYLYSTDPVPSGANTVSGVAVISYTLDGGPWRTLSETGFAVSGEGEHVVSYFAVDHAGNVEITRTISPRIKIDLNPPFSGISHIGGQQGAPGWYVTPVQVILAATDQTSGVAAIWYRYQKVGGPWSAWTSGSTFTLNEEGHYLIQHYAEDRAGHREPVQEVEGTIDLDLLRPTTTHAAEGTLGRNGWYIASPVLVTLRPADTMSGVRETKYRLDGESWRTWTGTPIVVSGEGRHTLEYYSVDNAGNREEPPRMAQVDIDLTPPPAMPSLPQPTPVGWSNRNDFAVSWVNPRDTSGVVGVYYKFDEEPQSGDDYTGSCLSTRTITQCTGIRVPSEGKHGIYIWLVDKAGNADYTTYRYRPNFFWYDARPPQTQITVSGIAQGLWYRSPVTITFQATDPVPPRVNEVSGVKVTSYSIGCGLTWQPGNQVVITQEGRTTICYRSEDNARNVEETRRKTLYIDRTAPISPQSVAITPAGWSKANRFVLSWTNPADVSGIIGAYYSHVPPNSPDDGLLIPGSGLCPGDCSGEIAVPGEGRWGLYFWFKDAAGNSGWQNPYRRPEAFLFDETPPTTTHEFTGTPGREEWWTSPVVVTLTASDNLSGVAQTRYRLRPPEQPWDPWEAYVGPLMLTDNGETVVRYDSLDQAENRETYHEYTVKIDTQPPRARVEVLPPEITAETPDVTFTVCWDGSDATPGSDLSVFDIQSKDGVAGSWVQWQQATTERCAEFGAQPGHVYYFRARASDVAGNLSAYSGSLLYGDMRTYVQAVVNGHFRTSDFAGWEHGGVLGARITTTLWIGEIPEPTNEPMALLGKPELGRGTTPDNLPMVPLGYGAVTQTITVPPLEDYADPTLIFRYRVLSYDTVYTGSGDARKLYDSFDVSILNMAGEELALVVRDGYFGPWTPTMPVADTGWKDGTCSLAPYAGQTIQIRFACYSREYDYEMGFYNTWAYVDDIRVQGHFLYKAHLPAIRKSR